MKKPLILVMLIITLCTTFLFENRVYADDTQDDEAIRTIDELNQIRNQYQIPSLSYSSILTNTAQTHNEYMLYHQSFTSLEEGGKLYFRGRYPWDRASYYGYLFPYVNEFIVTDAKNMNEGIEQLLTDVSSRYALFDPLYVDMGIHQKDNITSYLLGGEERTANYEVLYPYDKQKEVGVSSIMPITYSIYTSTATIREYKNIEVSLINTLSNEEVEIQVFTPIDDRNLVNTISILPLENLNLGTSYEVNIKGEIYFNEFISLGGFSTTNRKILDINSSFSTTENVEYSKESFITRAKFVEELMKISNFDIKESLQPIFPDVNINATNYKYIYTAYVNNIILGYSDGYYRPGANISREQAYTIIIRAYEKKLGEVILDDKEEELKYSDIKFISSYALNSLRKAKKIGILNDSSYEFNPSTYISETEFQQIIDRLSQSMN